MKSLEQLTQLLASLPGIGYKSAKRLSYFLLQSDQPFLNELSQQITTIKEKISCCSICGCYSEGEECLFCNDPSRDHHLICVVEKPLDVITLEQTGVYKGLYHVLGGVIAPLDGVGPEDLAIDALLERLAEVDEIVMATSLTLEGDATALYLQQRLKAYDITLSRLASGLPVGGDLGYADKQTLERSLKGRVEF